MKRSARLGATWIACCACFLSCAGPQPEGAGRRSATAHEPLVGGVADSGHPAVGLIVLTAGACSGTVITKRTVLTAAHCASDANPPLQFIIGPSGALAEHVIEVTGFVRHWGYNPGVEGDPLLGAPNDVALLQLGSDAPVEPIPLGLEPIDCFEGTPVTYVGFGLTDPEIPESSGSKSTLDTVVGTVVAGGLWSYTFPGAAKNACPGDSGGPVLMKQGNRDVVAGVLSLADKWCEWDTFAVRLDVHKAWLISNVASLDPEGLPASCGDGFCDFAESPEGCPEDCNAGTLVLGQECTISTECKPNLTCTKAADAGKVPGDVGVCASWCASPATGTGCPCGYICTAQEVPEPGLCVATGFESSNCGDKFCDPGESYVTCASDCTVPVCNELTGFGCCDGQVASWCENGIRLEQNCEGSGNCGWDFTLKRYACNTKGGVDPSGDHPATCPPVGPICGNGVCEEGEPDGNCPVDCLYPGYCGDAVCNGYENYANCEADCRKGICDIAPPKGCCDGDAAVWCLDSDQLKFSCQHHPQCGWDASTGGYGCDTDGSSEPSGEYPRECSAYVENPCGNGKCDKDETWETCPDDCPPPRPGCGDGTCAVGEDYTVCPADCFAAGCGKIGEEGCCDGELLKWCIGDSLFMMSCGDEPACGWSEGDGYYWCGTAGAPEPTKVHLMSCAEVEAATCGDGACTAGETPFYCPEDCKEEPREVCGDGTCGPGENANNCPEDCTPDPSPEAAVDVVTNADGGAQEISADKSAADAMPEDTGSGGGGSGGCTAVPVHGGVPWGAVVLLALLLCHLGKSPIHPCGGGQVGGGTNRHGRSSAE